VVLSIAGLVISFVGTILVAFSVRKGKVVIWKNASTGQTEAGEGQAKGGCNVD
jgi:hypothetical protein